MSEPNGMPIIGRYPWLRDYVWAIVMLAVALVILGFITSWWLTLYIVCASLAAGFVAKWLP